MRVQPLSKLTGQSTVLWPPAARTYNYMMTDCSLHLTDDAEQASVGDPNSEHLRSGLLGNRGAQSSCSAHSAVPTMNTEISIPCVCRAK